jgi:TRAP-type C4-dicarboxylate transport system substrate-binding protein
VTNLSELRQQRLWIWQLDDVWSEFLRGIGVHVVPTALTDAARAYDEQRTDGFIAIPSAALAFQWTSRVRQFTELNAGYLPACMVLSQAAWQRLSREQHDGLIAAAARFFTRFEQLGRTQDAALVGGLFEKQGVHKLKMSEVFRSEFFAAAREARERMAKLVGADVLRDVNGWLADYRAEHDSRPR